MIADYQFSAGVGRTLFPNAIEVLISGRTGKVREIREGTIHLATLNAKSGLFSLSLEGARRLADGPGCPVVVVKNDVVAPISEGGNVFAKHIVEADLGIRAGNETIIISGNSSLIAVGHSLLSGEEAKRFKYGVAIKVRRGVSANNVGPENGPQSDASSHGQNGAQT